MSNQINVSVKDFQIIKSANLVFQQGLNCIVGQSNNGKSALFRAMKSCIYNVAGTSYVRLGSNNFAVGMQIGDNTVILQKGKNSVYKINGEVYGKIGRTQLDEVAKALHMKELNINGVNEQINFLDQMEKPFLLDRTETELFRFIVDSGKDNNVTRALKSITQDRQQITRDITKSEGAIQTLEAQVKLQEQNLEGVDDKIKVCNDIVSFGNKLNEYKSMDLILISYKNIIDMYNSQVKKLELQNEVEKTAIPIVDNIKKITKKNEFFKELLNEYKTNSIKLEEYEKSYDVITSISTSNLNDISNRYKLLSKISLEHNEALNEVTRLSSIEFPSTDENFIKNVEVYKSILSIINEINSANKEIENCKVNEIPDVDKSFKESVGNYKVILKLYNEILDEESSIKVCNDTMTDIENKINLLEESLKDIKICPTCHQPLPH